MTVGLAFGVQEVQLSRPVHGDHEQETPPEPVSGVEAPRQIEADPDGAASGSGLITVGAEVAEQPAASVIVTL